MTAKSLCAISKSAEAWTFSKGLAEPPADLDPPILDPSPKPCPDHQEAAKPLTNPPNVSFSRLIPIIRNPMTPYSRQGRMAAPQG